MFTFKNDELDREKGNLQRETITVDFGRAIGIASRSLRGGTFGIRTVFLQIYKLQRANWARSQAVLAANEANKEDERSNAFWCDGYCVSAACAMMSIFAETLSICPVRVLFASAPSLRTIFEISFLSHSWHVIAARRLFAT